MNANIVLAEDEKIIALLLKRMLENRGYTVVKTFDKGRELIDYVKVNNIDVILMDIYLKGELNGIDATKEINSFSDAMIIYVTANADPATKEMALQTKQSGYFEKPLSDNELMEICDKIKSHMDKKH